MKEINYIMQAMEMLQRYTAYINKCAEENEKFITFSKWIENGEY